MASRTRLLAPAVLAVLLTSAAASAQARTPRPACRAVGVTVPSGTGATLALPCRHAAWIRIVGRPLHGILRRVAGGRGRFVYTPVAGFAGRDAVRFAGIARGRSSKPVTAAITVMPPRVEPAPPPPSAADPVVAQAPVQVHVDPAPPPPPPPAAYENPVSSSADDPFVLQDGDDYWELSTGDRFPMLHSSDLVHWTGAGRALASRPSWVVQTGDWNPWSPSVVHTAAGYVMFYTGLDRDLVHCVAVATSPTPDGPYTDRGPLTLDDGSDADDPIGCGDATVSGNVDPAPFLDSTGAPRLYVSSDYDCTSSTCVGKPTISEIDLTADLLHAAASRRPLFSGDTSWEQSGYGWMTVEGPAMVKHAGVYYLFYSGGSWFGAYGVGYATSSSPTGPFVKYSGNPILASTSAVHSAGGAGPVVTGPHGGLWLVYHGRDGSDASPRQLRIDPFSWTAGDPDVASVAGPSTGPQSVAP